MPIYVYECQKCEKVFEAEQRIIEDPLTDCDCGAKGSLKRLIQPTAVIFNGSGFHINDYSPKSESSSSTKSDSKSESKTDSTTETKTETPAKSETKTETKTEASPKTDKA